MSNKKRMNVSKQAHTEHKHAEKLQTLQSKRPKMAKTKVTAKKNQKNSQKLTLLQQILLAEMTLFVIGLFLAQASQNSSDSSNSLDFALMLSDTLANNNPVLLSHDGYSPFTIGTSNRISPRARTNHTKKSIKELQAHVKQQQLKELPTIDEHAESYRPSALQHSDPVPQAISPVSEQASQVSAPLTKPESQDKKSKVKKTQRDKSQTVKEVVESVCNEIHEQGYHAYNNPAQSTYSNKDNKFAISMPENISRFKTMIHMEGFRMIVDRLMKESWEATISSLRDESKSVFEQIVVDNSMRQLIIDFLTSLEALHDLRIQSACFEQLEGGACGEFAAHVSYTMARAFHELNMSTPEITRLGLKDPRRPRLGIFHGVSLIDGAPRQRYGRFFEPDNAAHRRGFICDPWFHQVASFTEMNDIADHPMLSNNVSNYTVESSEEIGVFPDISSLPEQIRILLEQKRIQLIESKFEIPAELAQEIQTIRDALQANEMPPEEAASSLNI